MKIGENKCVEFKRGGKDMVLAGRYHIIRQLGQGGMWSVWLMAQGCAENMELTELEVA